MARNEVPSNNSRFLHPVLMMAVTAVVNYVLHEGEFRTEALQAVLGE